MSQESWEISHFATRAGGVRNISNTSVCYLCPATYKKQTMISVMSDTFDETCKRVKHVCGTLKSVWSATL